SVFDQYLKYTRVPELQLRKKGKKLEVRWIADVPQLNLPVYVTINDKEVLLNPTNEWTTTDYKIKSLDEVTVDLKKFFITVSYQ
ncbi:MAG: M1 family peptidase, partial [Flavobacterium stagni]